MVFICKTLSPFYQSFIEIGTICQCIFAISKLSPLGKGCGPSFDQTWIPFTKGCFIPSLVKIHPVVLWKILSMYFCNFIIDLPLKRVWSFIWTNLKIPFTQECFVLSLVEIGPMILDKKWKFEKITDGWQVIRKAI